MALKLNWAYFIGKGRFSVIKMINKTVNKPNIVQKLFFAKRTDIPGLTGCPGPGLGTGVAFSSLSFTS